MVESITLLLRHEQHNVESLQEARALLEVATARLAASRRSDAHVARLRAITSEMEEEQSISPRLVDGDTEFHVEVARATGNPVLALFSQTIVAMLRAERLYREGVEIPLAAAFADHREIVDAIEDRDEARASQAMTDHLAHVSVPLPRRDASVQRAAS